MDNQTVPNIPKPSILKRLSLPKLIFIILGVVIVVELIFAVKSLRQTAPSPTKKLLPVSGGSISLVSQKREYKVGDVVPVSVRVSTGGHPTDGTDLILKFDPKVLEATRSALRAGKIYSEYPLMSVDPAGLIRISGIATLKDKVFNGIGVLAFIDFKARSAGKTALTVEFTQGKTDDSNIVEAKSAKDILEKAYNLELTVK